MSETNDPFNQDRTIGDNGESAVSFLISFLPNWKCIKFGIENHIVNLKEILRKEIDPIALKIKSMPDFVAFNTKTGETLLIEVKYRSNSKDGKYLFKYLEKYNEHWKGTKLIIVRPNEPHFIYVDLEKIDSKMKKLIEVGPNSYREYWDFNKVEKNIKELFPDLSDEDIEKASKMILGKR